MTTKTFTTKQSLPPGTARVERGADILDWAEVARRHVPGLTWTELVKAHNRASLQAALNRGEKVAA